ncbi:LacI family DNA-binding transcriptional regulator [Luteolibacter sp. LG18]|uniref:LacI family DNA-binding transcriptional regulator n=1 Tax=Luteolibacter sp. LG18 TaxID=2819286 RepID=UPI002B2A61A6|nr:LacI family transcriptional regulator [Luteolibacter sp. LG18]
MSQEPPQGRVSIRDIAKHIGVSHATVSLALRNHPRISEALRIKIKETAEEMGYRPDPMLAALAHYRRAKTDSPITSCLAWINAWPEPDKLRSYREFDAYWQGASTAAAKFGYRLEEFRMGRDMTPQRLHQVLQARGIHGLLIPPQKPRPDWQDFPWQHYSVVRFGRSLSNPRSHLVTADQVANTMLAFEKIRERGYRRVAFVTNESDALMRGHLFEAGYLAAQRFIPQEDRLSVFVTDSPTQSSDVTARFKSWYDEQQPDAIFTDDMGCVDLIAKAGLKVPDDVALAVTSILDAKCESGINQQPEEIGRVGLLMLNSIINDGARGIPKIFRQILVEGTWVDGPSLPDRSGKKAARKKAAKAG